MTKNRHSVRLSGYDYSGNGAYFVTICSNRKECLFGQIDNNQASLNQFGTVVEEEWLNTSGMRPDIELGHYAVMPNHFHAVVIIDNVAGDRQVAPTAGARGPRSGSIGALIAGFKAAVTVRINALRGSPGQSVWQRNYYEHIIRNDEELNRVHEYIEANPSRWAEDEENPEKEIGHA